MSLDSDFRAIVRDGSNWVISQNAGFLRRAIVAGCALFWVAAIWALVN
jgi:hypothetical protein